MAYDDDDDWPEPETDPAKIENAKQQLRSARYKQQKILQISYAVIAILVIVVIVLAYLH
jgi:t-SNARE complex subunit (syntaxin)